MGVRALERTWRWAGAAALLAASMAAPHAAQAAPPAEDLTRPTIPGRLSDERTVTRWTTALEAAPVRVRPEAGAPSVARLRFHTEDGLPEVYLALEQLLGGDGEAWIRIRVPRRPNGTTGWVRREELTEWRISRRRLVVSLSARRAALYEGERILWRAPVGIGAEGTPTPAGDFYVRERIPNLAGSPVYGPIAFGTSAYSRLSDWPGGGVVGVHGTNEPGRIPGRVSHGCVRVRNADVRRLARLLTVGTPVTITRAALPRRSQG